MKLQYNNWENFNLSSLESHFSSSIDSSFSAINSFNPYWVSATSASNTKISGYYGGSQITIKGNHFTDGSSNILITSFQLTQPSTELVKITGNVTFNFNTEHFSGYYSSLNYRSYVNNISTDIIGKLNINKYNGDVAGGSLSLIKISHEGYVFYVKGNMKVNADIDLIGGTVSDFVLKDNSGHSISFSGLSLSARTFSLLSDFESISDMNRLIAFAQRNLSGDFTIQAGVGSQSLVGNTGNNILNGGRDADTMTGKKGNDTYIVDNIGDTVIELSGQGTDIVKSSVSYTLTNYVENLTLIGSASINAIGNSLKNSILGNSGNNIIDGARGVDTLAGGYGNDTYVIDLIQTGSNSANYRLALQDSVIEGRNAGTDTITLRGNFNHTYATTLTLGANLENFDASLTGSTKLNLTGNTLRNTLTGNDANNTLDGGAGNDLLIGGRGGDTLKGGSGADVFQWGVTDLFPTTGIPATIDRITDFSIAQRDRLDLRDLLDGESEVNISDYIHMSYDGRSTTINISSTGQFTSGIYNSAEEDARIVLSNTNLFTATNSATEVDLIGHMINNHYLLIG